MSNVTKSKNFVCYLDEIKEFPCSSLKLHKSFDNYYEMKYHEEKYGYPFLTSQINKEKETGKEYSLCDHDNEDEFVTERDLCCEDKFDNQDLPPHYIGRCLERIYIDLDLLMDGVILESFNRNNLETKFKMLKEIRRKHLALYHYI